MYVLCFLYICIHLENIIQNRIWNALEVSDDITKYWTCAGNGFDLPTDKASLYSVKCKSIRSIEKNSSCFAVLHN